MYPHKTVLYQSSNKKWQLGNIVFIVVISKYQKMNILRIYEKRTWKMKWDLSTTNRNSFIFIGDIAMKGTVQ